MIPIIGEEYYLKDHSYSLALDENGVFDCTGGWLQQGCYDRVVVLANCESGLPTRAIYDQCHHPIPLNDVIVGRLADGMVIFTQSKYLSTSDTGMRFWSKYY